ncbi:MAG: hypothetical protein U0441_14405 [Polyangiaceae bacterium]
MEIELSVADEVLSTNKQDASARKAERAILEELKLICEALPVHWALAASDRVPSLPELLRPAPPAFVDLRHVFLAHGEFDAADIQKLGQDQAVEEWSRGWSIKSLPLFAPSSARNHQFEGQVWRLLSRWGRFAAAQT